MGGVENRLAKFGHVRILEQLSTSFAANSRSATGVRSDQTHVAGLAHTQRANRLRMANAPMQRLSVELRPADRHSNARHSQ